MIDLLLNIEELSGADLDKSLRDADMSYIQPTKKEIDKWPYKCDINISPEWLVGKCVISGGKEYTIHKIIYTEHVGIKVIRLVVDAETKESVPLTGSKLKFYSQLYKKEITMNLHPSRGGKFFWEHGFFLKRYDYKKLYYRTKDYREKYEKGLNESFGTEGARAPIHIAQVKEKISSTIEEKYGVPWFLKRGDHYSAVTETMIERHGVENIFYSDECQQKIQSDFGSGISKKESQLIKFLTEDLGVKGIHSQDDKYGQATVLDLDRKRTYHLDFLSKEKKVIVEFMGNYWHCNPKMYNADYFHPHKKKTARQIWEYDKLRLDSISRITKCEVLVVWEKDWDSDRETIVSKLKSKLL